MLDPKTLKELVKLMVANDLTELDLQDPQGERVTLKRNAVHHGQPVMHMVPAPAPVASVPSASAPAASEPAAPAADEGLVAIKSPMVGTFYTAAGPDAKAFVAVGSQVSADTTVCIIEAMKVFNEIKAETAGTIQKILVNNGQAVEFGQPLYLVKPG
ncbi:MAG: acetyl-CoA carboxylase biotin carboxyl carrier protein [Planctomycetes bacterium]|nr:acetyl-CoA carboxylase biotin carboxyl carrier protein [Planctomycetota bacterium]